MEQKKGTTASRKKNTQPKKKTEPTTSARQTQQRAKASKQVEIDRRNREIIGVIFIASGLFLLLTGLQSTGVIGEKIRGFTFGLVGRLGWVLPFGFIGYGIITIITSAKRHYVARGLLVFGIILCVMMMLHVSALDELTDGYLVYLAKSFQLGETSHKGGGLFGALLSRPLVVLVGNAGAYLLLVTAIFIQIIIVTNLSLQKTGQKVKNVIRQNVDYMHQRSQERQQHRQEVEEVRQQFFMQEELYEQQNSNRQTDQSKQFNWDISDGQKIEQQIELKPIKQISEEERQAFLRALDFERPQRGVDPVIPVTHNLATDPDYDVNDMEEGEIRVPPESVSTHTQLSEANETLPAHLETIWKEHEAEEPFDKFSPVDISQYEPYLPPLPVEKAYNWEEESDKIFRDDTIGEDPDTPNDAIVTEKAASSPKQPKKAKPKRYIPPPVNALELPNKRGNTHEDPRKKALRLEEALASFGITAKVTDIEQGPVLTRFELQPAAGVRVNRITNLADDIALHLAAKSVRIEAPIPGKAAIGIEIPNQKTAVVTLRELVETTEFRKQKSKLSVVLGKNISGQPMFCDLAKMPHLLIAGSTGSGKSVCINTIICSLIYNATDEEVKLILVDPKVVEMASFSVLPHLLIPVVTDPKKAANALNWAVHEMEERYKLFALKGARDLARYNEIIVREEEKALSQIVVIIDELADLMMVAPDDVEDAICRIAQMGRAAGIHLIVATQRPSADVITGLIKANIPSRIAFAVASGTDSRIILDSTGAEKLLGKGDMLYHPIGASQNLRVQCALVTDKEVERIKQHFEKHYGADHEGFDTEAIELIESEQIQKDDRKRKSVDGKDYDEYLPEAVEALMQVGHASISMVQRKFRIGYARAARIIDEMEQMGIVGPHEGSKPRELKINRAEYERIFGRPPNIPHVGS